MSVRAEDEHRGDGDAFVHGSDGAVGWARSGTAIDPGDVAVNGSDPSGAFDNYAGTAMSGGG
jgi:hypothetical protein